MNAFAQQPDMDATFVAARFHMIEGQLRPNKIMDERILDTMGRLPRELFVPPVYSGIAYCDENMKIMEGRYLMQPMILAQLLQEASIEAEDRVLEIAPATGYSTAVIAALAKEVIAVESDQSLQQQAIKKLAYLKIDNAEVHLGPLVAGWKEKGPYNVIMINGSVEFVPDTIFDQLAEGGRLVAVVRQYGPARVAHTGEARLYARIHGTISHRPLFDANIKPLLDFQVEKKFAL
jgi:protein-L-isoaspartate(D-aspartate) O-methyltransferase